MSKIENIIVNGKTYKVQTLGVIETFQLHLEAGKHLGSVIGIIGNGIATKSLSMQQIFEAFKSVDNTEEVVKIQKKVFAQVITPKNTFLSDVTSIESWFAENPNDLWEVFINAFLVLVGEYLPNFVNGEPTKATETAPESQKNIG